MAQYYSPAVNPLQYLKVEIHTYLQKYIKYGATYLINLYSVAGFSLIVMRVLQIALWINMQKLSTIL